MDFPAILMPTSESGLYALDISFHIIHTSLLIFVLLGAFFKPLVKYHFPIVAIIWISWLGFGLYVNTIGYCLITDWHWQIMEKRGISGLPPSYTELLYQNIIGKNIDDAFIANITAAFMTAVTLISGFRYFRQRR